MAGFFGVPSGATAVVVNVTAVNPAGVGHLSVYPAGQSPPTASNLDVTAGMVVANLVEVGLGTGGQISIFASTRSDVVVDLEGYVSGTAPVGAGSGLYDPLPSPLRICDTRANNGLAGLAGQCNGRAIAAGGHHVSVSVAAALPSAAIAVIANVTAVSPSGVGHLTVYPDGLATPPEASNIDYLAGQVIPNRVIVKLGSDGNIDVYSLKATNVIVDISGYYTAAGGTGAVFVPAAAPLRICDTRANNGLAGTQAQCNGKPNSANPLGPNTTRTVQVTGQPGVPTGAIAAVVNVTGVYPTQTTHLIVYPGGTPPGTSDLDPAAGAVEPNLVVPTLSTSGSFTVYNYAGTINLVVDLTGWYENYPAPPSTGWLP